MAVDAAAETRASAALIREGHEGSLRIGCTILGTFGLVPALLHAFKAAHPRVTVHLSERTSHPIERGLVRRELDVGLLHPPALEEGLTLDPPVAYRFRLAVAREHRLAGRARVALGELRGEKFVFVRRGVGPCIFSELTRRLSDAGVSPEIAQETETSLSTLALVSAGFGVGFVIEPLTKSPFSDVACCDVVDPMPTLPFAVGRREDRAHPLVSAFVETAMACGDLGDERA